MPPTRHDKNVSPSADVTAAGRGNLLQMTGDYISLSAEWLSGCGSAHEGRVMPTAHEGAHPGQRPWFRCAGPARQMDVATVPIGMPSTFVLARCDSIDEQRPPN
jgi:hypothetical protein